MKSGTSRKQLYLLGCTLIVVLGLFTLFQLRFWIGGPHMTIDQNMFTTQTGTVDLVFQVSNTTQVLINGRKVIPQVNGMVREQLVVSPGNTTATVELYDKYGTSKQHYLYITYPQ